MTGFLLIEDLSLTVRIKDFLGKNRLPYKFYYIFISFSLE